MKFAAALPVLAGAFPSYQEAYFQQKVDHFVVLYMENRGFDHIFGCMNLTDSLGGPPVDGIPPEGWIIPTDPARPVNLTDNSTFVRATCGTAQYVCQGGPGYDAFNAKFGCQHF